MKIRPGQQHPIAEFLGLDPKPVNPCLPEPKLIEANIKKACEFLHITAPVEISFEKTDLVIPKMGPTFAQYLARGVLSDTHKIKVSLSQCRSYKAIGRSLWHELTHAAQRERFADHHAYQRAYDRYPHYPSNPYELEARSNERNHDTMPLIEELRP